MHPLLPYALCVVSVEKGVSPALHQKLASLDVDGTPGGVLDGVEAVLFGVRETKDLEQQQRTVIVKSGKIHGKQNKIHCKSL